MIGFVKDATRWLSGEQADPTAGAKEAAQRSREEEEGFFKARQDTMVKASDLVSSDYEKNAQTYRQGKNYGVDDPRLTQGPKFADARDLAERGPMQARDQYGNQQMKAGMDQLNQTINSGGVDAKADARFNDSLRKGAAASRGQMMSAMQTAERTGRGSAGGNLAASLAADARGQDMALQGAEQAAGMRQDRMDNAVAQRNQLAGQMQQSNDQWVSEQNAQQQDWSKWMGDQRINQANMNTDRAHNVRDQNVERVQRVNDANVERSHTTADKNSELSREFYKDRRDANIYTNEQQQDLFKDRQAWRQQAYGLLGQTADQGKPGALAEAGGIVKGVTSIFGL